MDDNGWNLNPCIINDHMDIEIKEQSIQENQKSQDP
jgi:hypothetical protein